MSDSGPRPAIVTLLTDFGLQDPFAGVMKGVILGICPAARLVDLTHQVAPRDVRGAGVRLASAVPYFPDGTIHLAVVDPGVGGERRALAAATSRAFFVAPDNGLLSAVFAASPPRLVVALDRREFWLPRVSRTFHGRDVFAPVAAHLARGEPLERLGTPTDAWTTLPLSRPARGRDGVVRGHVTWVDRFGNCITDIPAAMTADSPDPVFRAAGRKLAALAGSYSDVRPGEAVAVVGSHGCVEIAVRDGHAARELGLSVDDEIECS